MMAMGSVEPLAMPGPEGPELPPGVGVDAAGTSDAVTSTVPPCDSRYAISAQICWGESVRLMSGMIGSYPVTTNVPGAVRDSNRYALHALPVTRLSQRAPIGPCPFSSVRRLGARVPRPWHAVHPPAP